MEQQVQSQQYVNGEWVTRSMDVYEIMAQARRQEDSNMPQPVSKPQHHIPQLGILSKTVLPSPYTKFILPANIRKSRVNDVVFISEDAVHLKEARAKGPLRHVASKFDFNGRILTARVYGEPRKVEVKAEHGTPIKKKDVHAQRRSTIGEEADVLPSEVIALITAAHSTVTLMFLWAQQSPANQVSFRYKTVRLPSGTSRYDRPGTFLAIDPRCRAMAVAALEGHFILYKTKSIGEWRTEIRAGQDTIPIEDERLISLDGRIMHMEFLAPDVGQEDTHVILLFIIVHKGTTKLTCYDWDIRHDLSTAAARAERVAVDLDDQNPSLLIPLSHTPAFLLVCDEHIAAHYDVLSGTTNRHLIRIPPELYRPLRPGYGKSLPVWMRWERAPRNDNYPKEVFYVAREDGRVMYVEVGSNKTYEISDAGEFSLSIDTAFANLDVDAGALNRLQPDVLVASGTAGDGCLAKVGSWAGEGHNTSYASNQALEIMEWIPNWAPISDLVITRLPGGDSMFEQERNSLFIANGRAPHGAISELRFGLRASVDESPELFSGCTKLSILDHYHEKIKVDGGYATRYCLVIIAVVPPDTHVFQIVRINAQWAMEQYDDESQEDDILREETIAGGLLTNQFSVQVTHKEARILSRPAMRLVDTRTFPDSLLAAAVAKQISYVAIVYRQLTQSILEVVEVRDNGMFGRAISHQLPSEPTCLELLNVDGMPLVLVGTADSSVMLFTMQDEQLSVIYQTELGTSGNTLMICESATLLRSEKQPTIIFGTRQGALGRLPQLLFSPTRIGPGNISFMTMGLTAVRLTPSTSDPSAAFVSCGTEFCQVRLSHRSHGSLNTNSVWFANQQDPGYQQSAVTAIDQLPLGDEDEEADEGTGGFLFVASGSKLLLARLDEDLGSHTWAPIQKKTVPRKLPTGSTPTKMTYSSTLGKMIVHTSEMVEVRASPSAYRTQRSTLQLIQAFEDDTRIKREGEEEAEPSKVVLGEYTLKNYERVYSILEWVITDHKGRPYHFVYVGTGIQHGPRQESGRRLFFKVGNNTFTLQKEYSYDAPVRCMALYSQTVLVTVIGSLMILEEYDEVNKKWVRASSKTLPSNGVHLSISQPYVYVSTAAHSLLCYGVDEVDDKKMFTEITLVSDSRVRQCAYHATVPVTLSSTRYRRIGSGPSDVDMNMVEENATLVLVSDKTCSLTGLFHPPDDCFERSDAHTLFEAHLPRSVTRIQRGDIRPPWRRSSHYPQSTPGIMVNDIIGTCSDGTVYNFSILSEFALKLLKLIQNLIELKEARKPGKKPSIVGMKDGMQKSKFLNLLLNGGGASSSSESQDADIKIRDVDPDEGPSAPKKNFVDGDVLMHFFDGDVLARDDEEDDSLFGLLTADVDSDVYIRFVELAASVGIDVSLHDGDGVMEKTMRKVGEWMEDVLREVL